MSLKELKNMIRYSQSNLKYLKTGQTIKELPDIAVMRLTTSD